MRASSSSSKRVSGWVDVWSTLRWAWLKVSRFVGRRLRRYSGRPKRRAGGLVVRGSEVLLVSSRKDPRLWILPSGTVEAGETSADAALREVEEEAGLRCHIERKVGVYHDRQSLASTSVYLMTVVHDSGHWEDGRLRKWWPAKDAMDHLKPRDRPPLRAYLLGTAK
mmetsp:Transcript_3224/g.10659  ORF Transcript_3224/g.10659 Transcript_3224/m.10659 type:complete len:166 (-) Transcript_3224:308-805(-)